MNGKREGVDILVAHSNCSHRNILSFFVFFVPFFLTRARAPACMHACVCVLVLVFCRLNFLLLDFITMSHQAEHFDFLSFNILYLQLVQT